MLQRYDNPREGRAFVSVKSQIAHMSILELMSFNQSDQ